MIFVTGGTGLVGSNLLLQLIERGEKVRALKRSTSNIREVEYFFKRNKSQEIFHKIEWIEGDLLDITFLPVALKDVTTIFHTAAFVSFDRKDENKIIQTNVDGTEALINEAIASGVKNFIYLSSIAAMDDLNPVTKLIDEQSTWNSNARHSIYAISKYRSEMEVWRGSQEGLNVLVVNPSVIIGSFDGKRESEKLFQDNFMNKYAPSGGTGFIDVRDVVNIILELYSKKIYNQKFILNAENLSYTTVLKNIADKKQKPLKSITNNSLKAIQIATNFTKFLGTPSLDKGTFQALTTFTKYDNSKIIKTLNYNFIPINEALDFHFKNYQNLISSK